MSRILHFTLGPVQGFIADARRTRDFWAGSFLLSRLAAEAMSVILGSGRRSPAGKIVFPEVEGGGGVDRDPLLLAVRTEGKEGGNPFVGSVPNRFKAEITDPNFQPTECADAIQTKWRKIAEPVWDRFVEHAAGRGHGGRHDVREIWDRQIDHFWEINWVIGPADAPNDGAWLDRRKNWRSHLSAGREGGDHCQLMGSYQELSGYVRAFPGDRPHQQAFWQRIRERTGPYNLRLDERLCAIALVKRLFPALKAHELRDVIGWVPAGNVDDVTRWPSVSYVAAVPWLEASWKLLPGECQHYNGVVRKATAGWRTVDDMQSGIYGETTTRICGVIHDHPFLELDGNFYFADAINAMEEEAFAPKPSAPDGNEKIRREETLKALGHLHGELDSAVRARKKDDVRLPSAHASDFYAVLIADGDSIGKNLGEGGEESARRGLAAFTVGITGKIPSVREIVLRNHGVTIYAGGDDVLALLPLDTAIDAAVALRNTYRQAFAPDDKWTMSAAVVFAQYHIPLRAVLAEAHHQLDAVAKEENGRDSLAVSVFKPGGRAFQWVSTWDNGESDGTRVEPPRLLAAFGRDLQVTREFTTGFFYNLRERYKPLFEHGGVDAGGSVAMLMRDILVAEFKESGGKGDPRSQVDKVLQIGVPFRRDETGRVQPAKLFSFDAALIARFLAEEGRWFMTCAAASAKTMAATQ